MEDLNIQITKARSQLEAILKDIDKKLRASMTPDEYKKFKTAVMTTSETNSKLKQFAPEEFESLKLCMGELLKLMDEQRKIVNEVALYKQRGGLLN